MSTFNHRHLDREEKKILLKHYTINQNQLVKVPFKNINTIKNNFFNDVNIFEKFLLNKLTSINKSKYFEIKNTIIEDLFNNIELKVNEFIAYCIIPDLIFDLDNPLYDIKYENSNSESAVPVNTHLYCDFSDYENIHNFLEINYESQLRPFHHDTKKLTLYCLKQGYIENFDKFIALYLEDGIKNNLVTYIEKEDYLLLEYFDIFDNKYGKLILQEFLIQVSRPYLNDIFNYKLEYLINLFNFEENKKYIEIFKERAKNQKKYIQNYYNNNKNIEEFVNILSEKNNIKIEIGDIIFQSENEKFKQNLLDHLISLFFYNKTFSFIIKEKTNIDNTYKFSGFLYLDRKEIIFFEKEDFKKYLKKKKNINKIAVDFSYKNIINKIKLN